MSSGDEHVEMPTIDEAFDVHDEASANWVVRRIVEARQYAERVKAWADGELRRARREEEFFLFRYGIQLQEWLRSEMARRDDRRKSLCLPAGTLGFRVSPRGSEITNEQELLVWCRTVLPSAVKVRESVSKQVILEYVEQTGEVPDGFEITAGTEVFYIK